MPFTRVVRKHPIRKVPESIGEHIREVRLTRGLYVKDVASLLGVNEWTVINWEKGATEPRIVDMGVVLSFLGYDPCPPQAVTLPERMYAYRRRQGLSIEAAAKRLRVDEGSWNAWEKGKVPWERYQAMLEGLLEGTD